MKILVGIALAALVGAGLGSGCGSTSNGGSQTNWLHCKTSAECLNGQECSDEHCMPSEAGIGAVSAAVRTSCAGRLDNYWGECLAIESECHGDTATLRAVRTSTCTSPGQALLSCTDPNGQHVQVLADIPAFGGKMPELSVCACEPSSHSALEANLVMAASDVQMANELGCRSDGVGLSNLSGINGDFGYVDGGPPGHVYGGPNEVDAGACKFGWGSAIGGCFDFHACFVGCKSNVDCPVPESGSPTIECAALPHYSQFGETCQLHCDPQHSCPDGMLCVHGANPKDVCLWPRAVGGPECP